MRTFIASGCGVGLLIAVAMPAAGGLALGQRPTGRLVVKVAVANYEPRFQTINGGVPCGLPYWQVCGWTSPSQSVFNIGIPGFEQAFDYAVLLKVVHWTNVNLYPSYDPANSGYYSPTNRWGERRFTPANEHYWQDWTSGWARTLDGKMAQAGYWMMLTNDFPHLLGMLEREEIDTIFVNGGPYFGCWETEMVGKGAYACNGTPIDCGNERLVIIGGIGYTERPGSGLHNYGHGLEENGLGSWFCNANVANYGSTYHSPSTNVNDWILFSRNRNNLGGSATADQIHLGNTHYAPNAASDYDCDNTTYVNCRADKWYSYPLMTNAVRSMNSTSDWHWPDYEDDDYQKWHWNHMPRYMGSAFRNTADRLRKGHMNNWLNYIFNPMKVGYPIGGDGVAVVQSSVDLNGWFVYRIEVPSNATSVAISGDAGAGASVYWGLRKNYVPYKYRVGGVGNGGGDEWTGRARTYSRTLDTASNFSKGLPGVWYLTYGGSGAGYASIPATYSPSVTVTISPKPAGVATIRFTSPASNDIFDVANGAYDTISWTVAGLTQGVRATYLAYQVTNNISPWVPIAEDYIFNINGTYDWRLPSSIKSTNARLMVMVEDVYGKFSTNYSGGFSLNTQGAYASLKSWVGAELPVSATRDRHVALGSEGTNLYFTMGNALNAGLYRLPKGSSSASDWSTLSAVPIPGTVNNDSGVGDMAYCNGYLWTLARSNDAAGTRCVYRYSIGANTWSKGGAMAGDGPNTACAPVSDTRIYGGWMGWYRVKNITDWLSGATSDIGDLNGNAAHPWDSCITTTDVYFIKQDTSADSNPAIFARINKSGTPMITQLAGPPFNAGAGCAIEYLPGRLCMDGRARLGVLRGCADSGTTDATANQFAIYDIAAATWSITSLPFPVDDGSELCLVDDTLNILAANGAAQPLRFKVLPEPGVLLALPTNGFDISGGQTCSVAWRTGRIPTGAAATNLLYYTTNGLAGTWLLAGAGPADFFTNYVWQAPLNVTVSQCYFRVVQTIDGWTDSLLMESFTNTSPTNFVVQFSATLPPSVVGVTNQSGQITGNPSGIIAGTNAGTLVAMWWTNLATGAAGTSAGGTSWSISDIALELGSNMVVVAGSNAAGVVAMATQLFLRAGAAFVFPAGQVALRMQQDTATNVSWRNGYMGATVASNYLAWSSNGLNGNWLALTSGTANATVTNFLFTAPVTTENSNCYFRVVHFCASWGGWYTNDSAAFTLVPEPMLLTISFMGVLLVRAARREF